MTHSRVQTFAMNMRLKQTCRISFNRNELMALTFLLVIANALVPNMVDSIATEGLIYAFVNTLGISVFVWYALFLAFHFAIASEETALKPCDGLVAGVLFIGCLIPIGPFMWVLLTALGGYLIWSGEASKPMVRSGWLMVAITVPMFWSKRFFNLFSEFFLAIDAELVSSITGTERISNLVRIPGADGFLQIAAPCSSLANVSLAILCWVTFTQAAGLRWQPQNIFWCGLSCLSMVAINVARISLIGFYPAQYNMLHGPIGETVVSWTSVLVVFVISYYGIRRVRFEDV